MSLTLYAAPGTTCADFSAAPSWSQVFIAPLTASGIFADPRILRFVGKQFIGAVEGHSDTRKFIPQMVQWYREGSTYFDTTLQDKDAEPHLEFPIDKLTKFMPAEEFDQALKEMHDGTTIKPILLWS